LSTPPKNFFRIFFQRRAAVPGGLCADWVGLANPRFSRQQVRVGKTNIRIRLKGVNPPLESRSDLSKERFRLYDSAQRGASSAESARWTPAEALSPRRLRSVWPDEQERRLAAPASLAWKIGSFSARLTMKRRPGFNRRAVNDHFSSEVASAPAPNQCRRSIGPPADPIYPFACHAAQGRSRPCTPADPALSCVRRPTSSERQPQPCRFRCRKGPCRLAHDFCSRGYRTPDQQERRLATPASLAWKIGPPAPGSR
jgi:hypothetical protein